MILGMSVATFTAVHTAISLIAIVLGIPLLIATFRSRFPAGINGPFLFFTIATSVTGFFFPIVAVGPPHIVGLISLIVLGAALYAFYAKRLSGLYRTIYVGTTIFALYLNVFVLVAQIFDKIPAAHALAPTASEPPFLAAQALTLAVFVALGVLALRRQRAVGSA